MALKRYSYGPGRLILLVLSNLTTLLFVWVFLANFIQVLYLNCWSLLIVCALGAWFWNMRDAYFNPTQRAPMFLRAVLCGRSSLKLKYWLGPTQRVAWDDIDRLTVFNTDAVQGCTIQVGEVELSVMLDDSFWGVHRIAHKRDLLETIVTRAGLQRVDGETLDELGSGWNGHAVFAREPDRASSAQPSLTAVP